MRLHLLMSWCQAPIRSPMACRNRGYSRLYSFPITIWTPNQANVYAGFKSGEVNVTREGDIYTIIVNIITPTDELVTGSYTGAIKALFE